MVLLLLAITLDTRLRFFAPRECQRHLSCLLLAFRVAGHGDRLHHRGEGGAKDSSHADVGVGKSRPEH